MTPQTQARPVAPQRVSLRAAQPTLDEMWDKTGVESRAYTANLIVITGPEHWPRVQEALSELQGRYAGRQIVGILREDAPTTPEVEVSLVGQRGGLYVERLLLEAPPENMLGAVLPLLRPAALNYVWWGVSAESNAFLLRELLEVADKIICDSLTFEICPGKHYALADLSWARLSPWREAFAQVFDDPAAAAELPAMTRLRLVHSGENDLPAWLFGAWVASALGWPDLSAVSVEAGHCVRGDGDLCLAELAGGGQRFALAVGAGGLVTITGTFGGGARQVERSLHLPPLPLSAGLAELLCDPRPSAPFEQAWNMAHRHLSR